MSKLPKFSKTFSSDLQCRKNNTYLVALLWALNEKECKGFSTKPAKRAGSECNLALMMRTGTAAYDGLAAVTKPMLTGGFRARVKEIHLEIYFLLPDSTISSIFRLFVLDHFSHLRRT